MTSVIVRRSEASKEFDGAGRREMGHKGGRVGFLQGMQQSLARLSVVSFSSVVDSFVRSVGRSAS